MLGRDIKKLEKITTKKVSKPYRYARKALGKIIKLMEKESFKTL